MSLIDDIAMKVYEGETRQSPWDTAEEIIALVRTALLSDEAVIAADAAYTRTWWDATESGDWCAALSAALDATGTEVGG